MVTISSLALTLFTLFAKANFSSPGSYLIPPHLPPPFSFLKPPQLLSSSSGPQHPYLITVQVSCSLSPIFSHHLIPDTPRGSSEHTVQLLSPHKSLESSGILLKILLVPPPWSRVGPYHRHFLKSFPGHVTCRCSQG